MNKTKAIVLTASTINALCLVFVLLYICFIIPSFSMWFYRSQYKANDTYATIQMDEDELHRLTRHTIRYIQGRESSLQITVVIDGVEQEFFSERELVHMKDVRDVFLNTKIAAIVLSSVFVVVTALLVAFARKHKKQIIKGLLYAALIFVGLFAVLAIYVAADWDSAFDTFHRIFFSNDFWQLGPSDLLLQILPSQFFMSAAAVILSFLAFFVFTIVAVSWGLLRRIKKRELRRALEFA